MYIADIQTVTFYANCATLLKRINVIFVSDMKTFLKILTLFIAVGAVGGAVMMLLKNHRWAYWAVLVCGIILMLWIALEWWIWGFVALSNIYFVFGVIEVVCGIICLKKWNS